MVALAAASLRDWEFWDGPRADVLAAAYRLRAELDGAIAAMEAADD